MTHRVPPHGILASVKTVAKNRRARFDYQIQETLEAGIVLTGQEVKSCRLGNVSLAGSYVTLRSGTPILKNATITPYAYASGLQNYDPRHDRILLLRKNELLRLEAAQAEKGRTIIPLEIRTGRFVKIILALAKGRTTIDKRHRIRERETDRRLRRGDHG